MSKKFTLLLVGSLLGIQLASAQEDRGETVVETKPSAPVKVVEAAATVSDGKSLTKAVVVEEEEAKLFTFKATTGWDSLYMFRGINVLGNGNGLYWLGGSVGVAPWENGSFTAGVWYGIGTGRGYQELDTTLDYTHTFGDFAASFGYINYYYPNYFFSGNYSQNELYWKLAYNKTVGPVTLTPSASYFYELGPNLPDVNGITKAGSSYLLLRLDASMALYKDIVSLAPWTAYGVSFGYNLQNSGNFLQSGNNYEVGVAMPIKVTDWFTVSGYVAYSYQWNDLYLTDPSTVWAGVNATFTF